MNDLAFRCISGTIYIPNSNVTFLHHTTDDVPGSLHVVEQGQQEVGTAVGADGMKMFSVAYITGFVARQLLRGINCNTCKACLISHMMLTYISKSTVLTLSGLGPLVVCFTTNNW
jgi:hypothetical protein